MTPRRARCRGFTLLEVMLALALASVVALSAYGLFEVIRRSERRQYVRMGETDEIARAYKTMERVFRTLVMSDRAKPGDEKALQERLRSFERAVDNDDPDPPLERDEPEPRLVLRPDPASPLLAVDVDGQATRMKAQVFEVTLRAPPVLGARPDSRLFERGYLAGRRTSERRSATPASRRSRSSNSSATTVADTAPGEEDEDLESVLIAPGVRGVFELIPDGIDPMGALGPSEGLEGWTPRLTSGEGYTLWWRELPPPPEPEQGDSAAADGGASQPPSRSREERDAEQLALLAAARRVPLITGLRWLRWEVFRGKRFDTRTRATWFEELPGYVKVSFQTVEGRRENWMFEVGWTNGPEPGTKVDRAAATSRLPPGLENRTGTPAPTRTGTPTRPDRGDRTGTSRDRDGSKDGGRSK